MDKQELYSIGEVSKICNISKKALRFYDKIGIICPDKISEENNYRFYSRETLLSVPVVKYFKQMGFKLEEMKEFLDGNTYEAHERGFRRKIDELRQLEEEIHMSYTSVKDWYDLILEAESVITNNVTEVSIKYMDSLTTCFLEQDFRHNYKESVINIEWTNYLEENDQAITGPVILWFENYHEKMRGEITRARILQKMITNYGDLPVMTIGNEMMAACYHIGSHDTINSTYEKIFRWAETHGYKCSDESIERYVTDYWTIRNNEEFVTEVLIKVTRED